ncbi:hypothetical protein DID88_004799 [Monilinia fructigena]|uniref:Uncharacterized protein n=1 Tax=Monilinia fructigena TaxID=38457 RepID=A0A395IRK5_9HELO|nr:hypothetical protein DID88_004799 [Monilinia fructigena]
MSDTCFLRKSGIFWYRDDVCKYKDLSLKKRSGSSTVRENSKSGDENIEETEGVEVVIMISINRVDFWENPVCTKVSIYGLEINVKKKLALYQRFRKRDRDIECKDIGDGTYFRLLELRLSV